jgi:hypothetical protein
MELWAKGMLAKSLPKTQSFWTLWIGLMVKTFLSVQQTGPSVPEYAKILNERINNPFLQIKHIVLFFHCIRNF